MSDVVPVEDLTDLYETAPCGYVSLSPDGRIVKFNATLANWLGSQSAALLGRPFHDILGFGGKIAFETHLAPMLRMQGHVHEIALELLRADGGKIPTIANAAEKRSGDGRHLFTRLTLFKAVDRRTYERGLVEARIKAEAESELQRETALLRDQFMAVLGHDLRNPLAAIAAGIGLVRKDGSLSARARAVCDEMATSVDRAMALIDDVQDLARGTLGGGFVLDVNADVPLTPVLEQVVGEIRAVAPDRAIEARFAINQPVQCDRRRIGQLASNLLFNALTHGAPAAPIRIDACSEGDRFVLSVANAGEPIPEGSRERLFQPFFRGAERASRNGLGLGLFIASEIARAHGGTLDFVSTVEETRFTFSMPRSANEAPAEA